MKEIKSILKLYESLKGSEERCAIAQVVRVEESSYRREGARMLVFESGVFEGGISGGCLEGDALKRSQMAIIKQEPSIVTYDTSKEKEIGVGLGCNGIIDVLISPLGETSRMVEILKQCVTDRKEHFLATITGLRGFVTWATLGESYYYDADRNDLDGCRNKGLREFIHEGIEQVRNRGKSATFHFAQDEGTASVFVELIPPQYHLAIYGDNYDIYPMIEMAHIMDWDVSLVGNIQKLKKDKLRTVANIFPKEGTARPQIDDRTAIVLMAHDYKTDYDNLEQLVKSKAPYIASLGPRKRFDKMMSEFAAKGMALSKEEKAHIYAPCGLEIGANTPEEIALSIF
ncbi:MAG: XdhC family protein, partial [Flavobacteriaceae bacterium]